MIIIDREPERIPDVVLRGIAPEGEILLFDIETTGLRKETTQLYLIGCAWFRDGKWHIRQWLTQCAADEYEVLEDFLSFASGFRTLVHFNGDRFDIPYLNYKCDYYMTRTDLSGFESFDIYAAARVARNLLGGGSMSQKSLELFLGIRRDDQMDGGSLIPVYYNYEKTGADEYKDLLLLHNYDDLQGMMKILPVLSYAGIFAGDFSCEGFTCSEDALELRFHLEQPVPVPVSVFFSPGRGGKLCLRYEEGMDGESVAGLHARQDRLHISLKLRETMGYLPLTPVSDYYYLPEEDMAVHKDLARFLDRSRKKRASSANCFAKKEGMFFYQPLCDWIPGYCLEKTGKPLYSNLEDLLQASGQDAENTNRHLTDLALFLISAAASS